MARANHVPSSSAAQSWAPRRRAPPPHPGARRRARTWSATSHGARSSTVAASPLERSVTRVHQHQVHGLLRGEPRDVLARRRRRERRRAGREPVREELVPKPASRAVAPPARPRLTMPRDDQLAPGLPRRERLATASSPPCPRARSARRAPRRAGSGAVATARRGRAAAAGSASSGSCAGSPPRAASATRSARARARPPARAARLVGVERIGLPVAAVQREHQLVLKRSRNGCSPTSVSSSPTSSACRPSARSASTAAPPRRAASPRAARSRPARTARRRGRRAAGRATARAPPSASAAAGSGGASRASATSCSKRASRTLSGSTYST